MTRDTGSSGDDVIGTPAASDRASARIVMDEFVARVRDNPKVWAVYASQEVPVIHVWTYVDSSGRRDRSSVYAAEWDLLMRTGRLGLQHGAGSGGWRAVRGE